MISIFNLRDSSKLKSINRLSNTISSKKLRRFTLTLPVNFIKVSKPVADNSAFPKKVQNTSLVKNIEESISKTKKKTRSARNCSAIC